jgi:hypothetical protein
VILRRKFKMSKMICKSTCKCYKTKPIYGEIQSTKEHICIKYNIECIAGYTCLDELSLDAPIEISPEYMLRDDHHDKVLKLPSLKIKSSKKITQKSPEAPNKNDSRINSNNFSAHGRNGASCLICHRHIYKLPNGNWYHYDLPKDNPHLAIPGTKFITKPTQPISIKGGNL